MRCSAVEAIARHEVVVDAPVDGTRPWIDGGYAQPAVLDQTCAPTCTWAAASDENTRTAESYKHTRENRIRFYNSNTKTATPGGQFLSFFLFFFELVFFGCSFFKKKKKKNLSHYENIANLRNGATGDRLESGDDRGPQPCVRRVTPRWMGKSARNVGIPQQLSGAQPHIQSSGYLRIKKTISPSGNIHHSLKLKLSQVF